MQLTSIQEIPWNDLRAAKFHPSPAQWEDQVLYFLMLDRFSNGGEDGYRDIDDKPVKGKTAPFDISRDYGSATRNSGDGQHWWDAGAHWCGGNLQGLKSKLGYLKRMGVTAVWVSPIFKQVSFADTYHGYGVQNFLDIDPHFGTQADLKDLVAAAHAAGIYVMLDVIVNHAGNVYEYDADRYKTDNGMDARWDGGAYRIKGFRNAFGAPVFGFGKGATLPVSKYPNDAIWPVELQQDGVFNCRGRISNWDYPPEFRQGDFSDLKDFYHGFESNGSYVPSEALKVLCDVINFWIAFADLDGLRIDTVKHMDIGAARHFTGTIREFASGLGKDNFYLLGEIAGSREFAFHTMELTGLDGALGIADIPGLMEAVVMGWANPAEFFDLFTNSRELGKNSHTWFRNTVVTMVDDHDKIGRDKRRFCALDEGWKNVVNAMALNTLTLGIPCIYYGTEQGFDGNGGDDRALREAMFGGPYGSLESKERHFFNERNWIYQATSSILGIRASRRALRQGRQYLRPISGNGIDFGYPTKLGERLDSIVAWSRLFADEPEILVAINTDRHSPRTVWVNVDAATHQAGGTMRCLYAFDPVAASSGQAMQTPAPLVTEARNGMAVSVTLPPAGLAIFEG